MVVIQVDLDPRLVNTIDTALFEILYCIALISIAYGNRGILARAIENGAQIDMESLVPSLSPTFVISALCRNSKMRYGLLTLAAMILVLIMPTISKYGLILSPSGQTTYALRVDWNSPRLYWWTRGQLYDCGMRSKLYDNLTDDSLEALTHYRKAFLTGEAFTTTTNNEEEDEECINNANANNNSSSGSGVGVGCVWYANTSNREYNFDNPGYGTVDRIPFDHTLSFFVGNNNSSSSNNNDKSRPESDGPTTNAITSEFSFRSAHYTGNKIPTIYSGVSTTIQQSIIYPEVYKVDGIINQGRSVDDSSSSTIHISGDGDEDNVIPTTLSFFDLDKTKLNKRTYCDYYSNKNSTFELELLQNSNNTTNNTTTTTIHMATFETLSAKGALIDSNDMLMARLYSAYGYTTSSRSTTSSNDDDKNKIDIAAMVVVCFDEDTQQKPQQQQQQPQPLLNSSTTTTTTTGDDYMHCLIEHLALLSTDISLSSSSNNNNKQEEQDLMYLLTHSARARLESVLIGTTDVMEAHVGGLFAALSMSAIATEVPTGQDLIHLTPIWFIGFVTMIVIIVGGMVLSSRSSCTHTSSKDDDSAVVFLPATPWEGYQLALADHNCGMIDVTTTITTSSTTRTMQRKCSDPFAVAPPSELALGIMDRDDDAKKEKNIQHLGLVPKNKIVPRNKKKELGFPPSQEEEEDRCSQELGLNQQTTNDASSAAAKSVLGKQQQQDTSFDKQERNNEETDAVEIPWQDEDLMTSTTTSPLPKHRSESKKGASLEEERSFLVELHSVLSSMSDTFDTLLMNGRLQHDSSSVLVEVPEQQKTNQTTTTVQSLPS